MNGTPFVIHVFLVYHMSNFWGTVHVLGAVLNIVLSFVFILLFGYYAAGYTTLACYIVYALFHYILMRKICRDNCEGTCPYDARTLLFIAGLFMGIGFLYLILYSLPVVRYGLTVCIMILIFILRKNIALQVKKIVSIRNKKI